MTGLIINPNRRNNVNYLVFCNMRATLHMTSSFAQNRYILFLLNSSLIGSEPQKETGPPLPRAGFGFARFCVGGSLKGPNRGT